LLLITITAADGCMKVTPGTPGIPACKTCAQSLILKTTVGAGSKVFDTDTTDSSGTCAVRTLTCVGDQANIELNNMDGVTDPPLVVTCNADGTAWLFMGVAITQAECSIAP
ncbi:hypothetical protein PENTCL1PPCAC_1046, partial [Pristionchus entomophagus]